ncbi:MAG: Gfo/Idh/MocA family oxidoreductase [Armatimonadota bacterium]
MSESCINIIGLDAARMSEIQQQAASEGRLLATALHYSDVAWLEAHQTEMCIPAFWWRYSQPFQRLLAELRKGTIGNLLAVKVKVALPSSDASQICPSGMDICQIIAGSEPKNCRISRPTPASAHSILELKFASGLFASSVQIGHVSTRPPSLHLRVVGDTGILQAELFGPMVNISSEAGWQFQPYIEHPMEALWAARHQPNELFPTIQQALAIAYALG